MGHSSRPALWSAAAWLPALRLVAADRREHRGGLALVKLTGLFAISLEALEHACHLLVAQNDRFAGEHRRPILPAESLDLDGKPQRPVEVGPKADLAMIGEQTGGAAFYRLEHDIRYRLGAELRVVRNPERGPARH